MPLQLKVDFSFFFVFIFAPARPAARVKKNQRGTVAKLVVVGVESQRTK
jgi:hypothetical protein